MPDKRPAAFAVALYFTGTVLHAAPPDFEKQIKPLLEAQCIACHGPQKALGGLALQSRAAALKGGGKGPALVPGTPEKSRLYTSMELAVGNPAAMPPGGPQLPAEQRAMIREWIAAGAAWPENVSLRSPLKAAGPDERALVQQLHDRIAAKAANQLGSDMKAYKTTIPNTEVSFDMVPIQPGEFTMGTPEAEADRSPDEGPQRKITIGAFWMGAREVTWDEYRLFMFAQQAGETSQKDAVVDAVSRPTRPYVEMSFGMGINGFPAISMTQHAANKYAQWLSARTGVFYRLPTEAEWEYACRAGTTTAYSFGDDAAQLGEYGWFLDNSSEKYQPVGKKKPNPWGLYDMHGNVTEWTLDQYAPSYPAGAAADPWVRATKNYPHTVRGGSWNDPSDRLRCGARLGSDPSWKMQDPQLPKSIWYHTDAQWLGFRLVRPLKVPSAEEMYKYWNSGVEKE